MDTIISSFKTKLTEGRIAIFAGAGVSIAAPTSLPSFLSLRNYILEVLLSNTSFPSEKLTRIKEMKTKPELLFETIWMYMGNSINPIRGFHNINPNINHLHLAQLCKQGVKLILTTNFDDGIERALTKLNLQYYLICGMPDKEESYNDILNKIQNNESIILWKLHGDASQISSLCYTISQVAKLQHSVYIKKALTFILNTYNLFTCGYSGFDDDIFPALYDIGMNKRQSQMMIYWNSHSNNIENKPSAKLKTIWSDAMKFLFGDIAQILQSINGDINTQNIINDQSDWKCMVKQELFSISADNRMAIVGKYFHVLGLHEEANYVWRFGLTIDTISLNNRLRFLLNTATYEDSRIQVFKNSVKYEIWDVAEIALYNIIYFQISENKYDDALTTIRIYFSYTKRGIFKLSNYRTLIIRYLDKKYNDNNSKVTKYTIDLHKKNLEYYLSEGDVINASDTYSYLISCLASNGIGTEKELSEAEKFINYVTPYTIPDKIAGLYYSIAILTHTVISVKKARKYIILCEQETDYAYQIGFYQKRQYLELKATILHEYAAYGTAREAINLSNKALMYLEESTNYPQENSSMDYNFLRCTILIDLGDNYTILHEFKKAKYALDGALENAVNLKSIKQIGRIFRGYGDFYYEKKEKATALGYYLKAYDYFIQCGQNTDKLLNRINEIKNKRNLLDKFKGFIGKLWK